MQQDILLRIWNQCEWPNPPTFEKINFEEYITVNELKCFLARRYDYELSFFELFSPNSHKLTETDLIFRQGYPNVVTLKRTYNELKNRN